MLEAAPTELKAIQQTNDLVVVAGADSNLVGGVTAADEVVALAKSDEVVITRVADDDIEILD